MGQHDMLTEDSVRARDTDGQPNWTLAGADMRALALERARMNLELEHRSNARIFAESRIALQLLEDVIALARSG